MVQIPMGMARVGVRIAARLVTATLSARSPGGQQMVLTTSMFNGQGSEVLEECLQSDGMELHAPVHAAPDIAG